MAEIPPANVLVAVVVAMMLLTVKLCVPVATRVDPFQPRRALANRCDISRPIVPEAVMVPPIKPLLVAMEVTVPFPPPPPLIHGPAVDVAKHVAMTLPPNVELAVPITAKVPVAVRFPAKKPFPFTSNLLDGLVVPMPKKPVEVWKTASRFPKNISPLDCVCVAPRYTFPG